MAAFETTADPVAVTGPSRAHWWILVVIAGAQLMVVLDSTIMIIALPSNPFRFLQFLHANFGFAAPVAVLIFIVARYRTTISRALSHDWIVRCGEASYSIYMLHAIVLGHAGLAAIPTGQCAAYSAAESLALSSISLLRLVTALLVIIGFSLVIYELLELPMRRRLRLSGAATDGPH